MTATVLSADGRRVQVDSDAVSMIWCSGVPDARVQEVIEMEPDSIEPAPSLGTKIETVMGIIG